MSIFKFIKLLVQQEVRGFWLVARNVNELDSRMLEAQKRVLIVPCNFKHRHELGLAEARRLFSNVAADLLDHLCGVATGRQRTVLDVPKNAHKFAGRLLWLQQKVSTRVLVICWVPSEYWLGTEGYFLDFCSCSSCLGSSLVAQDYSVALRVAFVACFSSFAQHC